MKFISAYIAGVLLLLAILILSSCSTVKYVEREKLVYDITAIKTLETEKRLNRQLREENERLKSDSTGVRVEFYQDPIYKPSPFQYGRITDTAIINRLNRIDTFPRSSNLWYEGPAYPWKTEEVLPLLDLRNKDWELHNQILPYPINPNSGPKFILRNDGSIEVNGNVKSVNVSKTAQETIKKKIDTHTDSLAIEKKKDSTGVTVKQESSKKEVTRKVGPSPWLMLLIGFVVGCIITYYRHRIPVLGPILKFINGRFFNRLPPRA